MHLLDDAALDRVYFDQVRPLLFDDLSASAAPELIVAGGQPSAGKTAATVQAVRDLRRHGGAVAYINGDELRPFHPQYAALVAADRGTVADKTGADVACFEMRVVVVVDPEASKLGIYERFAAGLASPTALQRGLEAPKRSLMR